MANLILEEKSLELCQRESISNWALPTLAFDQSVIFGSSMRSLTMFDATYLCAVSANGALGSSRISTLRLCLSVCFYARLLFGHSTSRFWPEMKASVPKRELSVCLPDWVTGSTTFLPFLCVALSKQTWREYKRVALFYKFTVLISRFTWLHSFHGFVAKCVEANNVRKVGVLFRVERMSAKRPLSLIETEAETDTGTGSREQGTGNREQRTGTATTTSIESGNGTRTVSGLPLKPIKANSAELTQCRSRIAPGGLGG